MFSFILLASAAWLVPPGISGIAIASGDHPAFFAARGSDAMTISSSSFSNGGNIPRKFTCDGEDVSPQLSWMPPPTGTQSFALIADDPDAPAGTWTHWVIFNLPPTSSGVAEGIAKTEQLSDGGSQGKNDFHRIGYGGPCPPPGKAHRYFFKLYALDHALDLKPGATKQQLEQAMQGHILGEAVWMGRYRR